MKRFALLLGSACAFIWLQGCGAVSAPPPVATHFSVAPPSASPVAGVSFSVTVSALDASGAIFTTFAGVVALTSSDPQAVLPAAASLTNGTGSFQVTLKTAGNQTVTASGGGIIGVSSAIPVSAAAPATLSLAGPAASPVAGTAFNITVNALDAFSNFAASYAGTVQFASSDPQAALPGPSKLSNGTGMFSVTLKTTAAAGQTVSARDTTSASIAGTSNPITVVAAAASHLSVSAPAAATIGIAFTATVNALDAYGNVAIGYSGTVHLTSSDPQAVLPSDALLPSGTQNFLVTLKTPGPQTVSASDLSNSMISGKSSAINIVSNAATHLSVTGPAASVTRQTISITVTALDAANNPSTGYAGTVHFTSSDSLAKLPPDSALTAGTGTANFPATFETAGNDTIAGTDTSAPSITGSGAVSVSAAPQLAITSGPPPNGTVGVTYGAVTPQTQYQTCRLFGFRVFCNNWTTTKYGLCSPLLHLYPCWTGVTRVVQIFTGFAFAGSGGVPSAAGGYTWSAALPSGLTVDAPTGRILGTPTAPTPPAFTISVTVTDFGNPAVTTTKSYALDIHLPPVPAVNLTPPPPPGVVGQPYSYTFTATGYPPLTWIESGALPAGLTFNNSSGLLSGKPTLAGSNPITVTATDQFGQQPATAQPFTLTINPHGFVPTGKMSVARELHTATLLISGKVLIAGGWVQSKGSVTQGVTELYDPGTGAFTSAGNLLTSRAGHTATLFITGPDAGKVLLAGGLIAGPGAETSSTEIYDPTAQTFTTTGALQTARFDHTATLLTTGKVLIVGGAAAAGTALASAELFDPATGTFAATGNLQTARQGHTATLLSDGKVLIAGGQDAAPNYLKTAEIYDPVAGTFTAVAGMMATARTQHTGTLLTTAPNAGKVLLTGGLDSTGKATNAAELFDPSTGSFTATTTNMGSARAKHSATLLNDGTVLLAGGVDATASAAAAAEIFNPATAMFAATGGFVTARDLHTATLLSDGSVLATGGDNGGFALASAEVYH